MSISGSAVLMLGFGGPASFAEVRPFIEQVVAGRGVPPARVDEVVEQYRVIGGKSPFLELTMQQLKAVERELLDLGSALPVYLGTLYGKHSIEEAVSQIVADRIERLILVVMAPHRTEASFNRYLRRVESALAQHKCDIEIRVLPQWHTHPLFISALCDRVQASMKTAGTACLEKTKLIFTAHSVPQEMGLASGYLEQIQQTGAMVAERIKHDHWEVAFQSRSGSPTVPWLGPDISESIGALVAQGFEKIVVMPVGFVCDHVEVLFDLDIKARAVSQQNNLKMVRAGTVGCHPDFIHLISSLVAAEMLVQGRR